MLGKFSVNLVASTAPKVSRAAFFADDRVLLDPAKVVDLGYGISVEGLSAERIALQQASQITAVV